MTDNEIIQEIKDMIEDININEIKAHDSDVTLHSWIKSWRGRMKTLVEQLPHNSLCDLWIRDKSSGRVHKIGTNSHDMLSVDDNGTVRYHNLQNGDGCPGYRGDDEALYGYEFVPNQDDHGYPVDPTEE